MTTTAWIGGRSPVKQRMHALTQLFRRDCGPLRRPVDRAEAVALTVLIATFAVAWLALAIVTGRWAYDAGVQQQRAEQGWHKTTGPDPTVGRSRAISPPSSTCTPESMSRSGLTPRASRLARR